MLLLLKAKYQTQIIDQTKFTIGNSFFGGSKLINQKTPNPKEAKLVKFPDLKRPDKNYKNTWPKFVLDIL